DPFAARGPPHRRPDGGRGQGLTVAATPRARDTAPGALNRRRRAIAYRNLHGPEIVWAIAFLLPYAAVFFAFLVYPVAYGLWMAREPALYRELAANLLYARAIINTVWYVGLGVNVQMFLDFLLSGFFMRRRLWITALIPL